MGDYNTKNTEWNYNSTDGEGTRLAEAIEKNNMFVLNNNTKSKINETTREHSNMDLIIATHTTVTEAQVESGENLGSDHQIIKINIKGEYEFINKRRSNTRIYDQKKMDWRRLLIELTRKEDRIKQNGVEIQETYNTLEKTIREAMENASMRETGKESNSIRTVKRNDKQIKHKPAIWWDIECRDRNEEWEHSSRDFIKTQKMTHRK
ncbi:hypothetical protein ANTPLA_LOCUS8066 [Anthophora plagiata]